MVYKPGKLVFKACSAQMATVGIVNASDASSDVDVVILDSKNFCNSLLDQIFLNFFLQKFTILNHMLVCLSVNLTIILLDKLLPT